MPQCMRDKILHNVRIGHQGIVKCKERAHQSIWWSGLSVHISQLVKDCSTCSQHREPVLTSGARGTMTTGQYRLILLGENPLLLVFNYFSHYIEVALFSVAKANTVIAAMTETFSQHEISKTVMSNIGSEYGVLVYRYYQQPIISAGEGKGEKIKALTICNFRLSVTPSRAFGFIIVSKDSINVL